jgi:two-component system LytT family sensor kinase
LPSRDNRKPQQGGEFSKLDERQRAMKKKQVISQILLLYMAIAAMLFLFISTLTLLTTPNGYDMVAVISNLFVNLPLFVIPGLIDYGTIRFLHARVWKSANISHIILDVVIVSAITGSMSFVSAHVFSSPNPLAQVAAFLMMNCIIVLFIELLLYHNAQMKNEKRIIEMEKEKAVYQLNALKNQVNPHFLFNSLNVLASLTYQNPAFANTFAKKFANVYRYILTTSENQTVELKEELDFVRTYLYLEKMRFAESLKVSIEDNTALRHSRVIPVSIQTLVENALKHNVASEQQPLNVIIHIGEDGVTVSNNIQLRNNVQRTGTGLANLQRQYAISGQEIAITKIDNKFIVFLPYLI